MPSVMYGGEVLCVPIRNTREYNIFCMLVTHHDICRRTMKGSSFDLLDNRIGLPGKGNI